MYVQVNVHESTVQYEQYDNSLLNARILVKPLL